MTQTQHSADHLDMVFGAIADATRRSILDRLREGPLTVTELAEPFSMSLNAVSKHLKKLEAAGLILREIRGREHSCHLAGAAFEDAMSWMAYYSKFWNGRVNALERHLIEKRRRRKK